jgi:uncharacterized membrane protein YwaF
LSTPQTHYSPTRIRKNPPALRTPRIVQAAKQTWLLKLQHFAKLMEYLLTSVISVIHQKEKQDDCGVMDTTATKIVAGSASHSWRRRIGSTVRNIFSSKTNAFIVIQK